MYTQYSKQYIEYYVGKQLIFIVSSIIIILKLQWYLSLHKKMSIEFGVSKITLAYFSRNDHSESRSEPAVKESINKRVER